MHQALGMRLREGCAHLLQHVHRAGGWYGAEPLHQRLEIDPVQQLHHEVERAVVSLPEVVQLDGVARAQPGGGLGLAPEPLRDAVVGNGRATRYRLGVLATSDAVSTHSTYARVTAEPAAREDIREATRKRKTYAAA